MTEFLDARLRWKGRVSKINRKEERKGQMGDIKKEQKAKGVIGKKWEKAWRDFMRQEEPNTI